MIKPYPGDEARELDLRLKIFGCNTRAELRKLYGFLISDMSYSKQAVGRAMRACGIMGNLFLTKNEEERRKSLPKKSNLSPSDALRAALR